MTCLTFPPFIPQTGAKKNLSALEEIIQSTSAYARESDGAACVFVRGSTVSSFDNAIVRAHEHSDIDLITVSQRRGYVNQYLETLNVGNDVVQIPIDVRNLNQVKLQREAAARGVME